MKLSELMKREVMRNDDFCDVLNNCRDFLDFRYKAYDYNPLFNLTIDEAMSFFHWYRYDEELIEF